jgi:hypothetical protein
MYEFNVRPTLAVARPEKEILVRDEIIPLKGTKEEVKATLTQMLADNPNVSGYAGNLVAEGKILLVTRKGMNLWDGGVIKTPAQKPSDGKSVWKIQYIYGWNAGRDGKPVYFRVGDPYTRNLTKEELLAHSTDRFGAKTFIQGILAEEVATGKWKYILRNGMKGGFGTKPPTGPRTRKA